MTGLEKKTIAWIDSNHRKIVMMFAVILAIMLRILAFNFISSDMEGFLVGWFGQIEQLGRIKALKTQVGNYSVAYQTLIALMTYIPINCVYQYKALSVLFDFVLAVGVRRLYICISGNKEVADRLLLAIIFLPTLFINSAAWGQCDSIYTAFLIWSLVFFFDGKYKYSFALYGMACAFKLQAIFLLPFFLFAYVRKKDFSALHFFIIPAVMEIVCIPAMIVGRGWKAAFSVYRYQMDSCDMMYFNYPSFWSIMSDNRDTLAAFCKSFKLCAIVLTVAVLLLIMFGLWEKNISFSKRNTLYISFLLIYACVLFLPGMHERYGFAYEILAIVVAFVIPKTTPLTISMIVLSLMTYGQSLLDGREVSRVMGVINLALFSAYIFVLFNEMITEKNN